MAILEEGCGQPLHLFVEITYRLQSIIYVVKLGQEGLKTTNKKYDIRKEFLRCFP